MLTHTVNPSITKTNQGEICPITFSLYQEIMHEIQPCEIEDIDVTIHLANKQTKFSSWDCERC